MTKKLEIAIGNNSPRNTMKLHNPSKEKIRNMTNIIGFSYM